MDGGKVNSSVASTKRVEWIDILKGICAILVILIHTQKPEIYAFLFRPFFLMCFFFASGYTSKIKKPFFVKSFVETLAIVTIVLLVKIIHFAIASHKFIGFNVILGAYYQNQAVRAEYPVLIWFIPCIFLAKSFFQIVLRISKEKVIFAFILSSICTFIGLLYCKFINICLPWHIEIAFLVQIFFWFGFAFKKYESKFEKVNTLLCAVLAFVYFIFISINKFSADLNLLAVSDWSSYMIAAVLGTFMMVSLCKKINQNKVLSFIGKNSLFFFAFQDYFIIFFNKYLAVRNSAAESKMLISLLVTILSSVCLCCLIVMRDYIYNFINKKFNRNFKPII